MQKIFSQKTCRADLNAGAGRPSQIIDDLSVSDESEQCFENQDVGAEANNEESAQLPNDDQAIQDETDQEAQQQDAGQISQK